MQALKELAYIVTQNKLRTIELIGDTPESKSKITEFYEGILEGKFSTDDDAARFFYEADKNYSGYQKLKSNLKSRLINTIFFIDTKDNSHSERQRAYYICYREWAAAKILIGKGARLAGVNLCHKILKLARKYEITELILDISRTLRLHYGARVGDFKKFEQFNKIFKEYEAIWHAENRAEELYTELVIKYVNNKSTKENLHQKAQQYYDLLKEDLKNYNSYRLYLCSSLIKIIIHSSINAYEETIQVCNESINLFKSKKYQPTTPLQIYYYQLLVCYTQLKKYKEGKAVTQKCIKLLEEGSYNWFKYHEYYLILCMHTKQYQDAYDIFLKSIQHPRFQFLPSVVKEMWRIFEAYIHYLVDLGKVNLKNGDKNFNKFKLGRFLNETPIYSKDKRGMNIPILVIHILFMIQQQKYDRAIDKIEAIEKYCSRHLRNNDLFRSNCFIKMLMKIPICSFHKAGVVRKAGNYLKRLQSVPLDVANQAHEIEIIPYENLWEMALETLENKFHKLKSVAK